MEENKTEIDPLFLTWYITRNCDQILIFSNDNVVMAEDIKIEFGA